MPQPAASRAGSELKYNQPKTESLINHIKSLGPLLNLFPDNSSADLCLQISPRVESSQ